MSPRGLLPLPLGEGGVRAWAANDTTASTSMGPPIETYCRSLKIVPSMVYLPSANLQLLDRSYQRTVMRIPPAMASLSIISVLAYLGIAILGAGGLSAFFSHPARIALALTLLAL